MKYFKTAIILILALCCLTSCVSSKSANVYSRDVAMSAHHVKMGIVMAVKPVEIEGTNTPVGAGAGGVAGGLLGSLVGNGNGKTLATLVGALAGAAVGNMSEDAITSVNGLEVVVKLDDGQSLVVVQADDEPLRAGDRVLVIYKDGVYRVSKG